MLVLSRHVREKIVLPELGVTVTVVAVKGSAVRVGIEAPPQVRVLREELRQRDGAMAPPATRPVERTICV
jgi:carbon storage regulator CsrA